MTSDGRGRERRVNCLVVFPGTTVGFFFQTSRAPEFTRGSALRRGRLGEPVDVTREDTMPCRCQIAKRDPPNSGTRIELTNHVVDGVPRNGKGVVSGFDLKVVVGALRLRKWVEKILETVHENEKLNEVVSARC